MTAEGAHARALEAYTRRLLHEHAATVVPGDGLPLIRARIARRPWWRRVLAHLTASKTAARGATRTAAKAEPIREDTAMTTIIQRRAREVRAGDIIVRDPDHSRAVRWRVTARKLTADGTVIVDYFDITDEPEPGIAHFDALTLLDVEPVGGAA